MTVRIDRRSLLAGAAGLASLGVARRPRRLGAGRPHPPDVVGLANRNERTAQGDRAVHRRQPGRRPSRARAPAGTTTGPGSRRRPPAATRPTSCRWTTATSSSTRAAACCCRSTTRSRPATLDLSGFSEDAIAGGKVDGKIYGISLGANSSTMIVNKAAFEEAGVALPERGMTWDEYAARAAELTEKAGKRGFYGSADGGGVEPTFECWLRQRGKALYDAEGKLGFDAGDATEWFAMWQAMRDSGACVPADLQALDQLNIETSMVSLGQRGGRPSPTRTRSSASRPINQAPLVMVPYPTGGAELEARPVPQAVDVLQRLRQHRRAGRGGEVHQLLHQRSGGDRGARRRARRARVGGGARGAREHARRARQGADRLRRRTSATSPGRCRRRRRPAPARSTSR